MIKYLVFFIILLLNTACDKSPKPLIHKDSKVIYLNSIRWEEQDFKELSKKMVQNILSSKDIKPTNEKTYVFDKIRNDTYDQINTQMLQKRITSFLIKTTKFRFLERDKSAKAYIFKGKLSSIFKKNSNSKDMFFNFNLMLIHPITLEVIWSHDIEIRKIYKRPIFSW